MMELSSPKYNGYEPLIEILIEALDQAALGKGRERHANDKPFLEQPMFTIAGHFPGFCFGQAVKKLTEAQRTGNEADVLGAIVYTASGLIDMRARKDEEKVIHFPEASNSGVSG